MHWDLAGDQLTASWRDLGEPLKLCQLLFSFKLDVWRFRSAMSSKRTLTRWRSLLTQVISHCCSFTCAQHRPHENQ